MSGRVARLAFLCMASLTLRRICVCGRNELN